MKMYFVSMTAVSSLAGRPRNEDGFHLFNILGRLHADGEPGRRHHADPPPRFQDTELLEPLERLEGAALQPPELEEEVAAEGVHADVLPPAGQPRRTARGSPRLPVSHLPQGSSFLAEVGDGAAAEIERVARQVHHDLG